MKTYRITSQKELEQFKDEYGYKVDGNLECSCSLYIQKRLYVEGYLYIQAGGYIEAGGYIKAGGSYGISAGLQITCKRELKFGLKCFAGICTWRDISECEKTITCGKFEGGVIEYGILNEVGMDDKVEITCEGKTVKISRESAKALNLI